VQNFNGFLKILRSDLKVSDRVLLLLYERGSVGASFDELSDWIHAKMRRNLRRTLNQLEHDHALIHSTGNVFQITNSGIQEVERRKLHDGPDA
jgi:hypothetical protein